MSNFQVYRGVGNTITQAYKIECREQGHIRKMQSATYREEIMTDDSIKIQVLSVRRIDFRLRDFIIYEDKPYFLNTTPKCTINESKMYIYDVTFEGAMFELGRVAYIMQDAFGYEYYGQLVEFARLIADSMNRINAWVEWIYEGETYKARYKDDVEIVYGQTTHHCKRWGVGFNHELDYMCEKWIITEGMPSVGGHPIDPEDCGEISACTITQVNKWSVDFPTATQTLPIYPNGGSGMIAPSTIVVRWPNPTQQQDLAYIKEENWQLLLNDYNKTVYSGYVTDPDNPDDVIPTIKDVYEVCDAQSAHHPVVGPLPILDDYPTSVGEKRDVSNDVTFYVVRSNYAYDLDPQSVTYQQWVLQYENMSENILNYKATYTAIDSSNDWQITPIQSGSGTTQNDFGTESKLLSYDCHSCLAVLQDICSQWQDWEWIIDNVVHGIISGDILVCGTIKFRMKGEFDADHKVHNMGFGKSGGLSSIVRKFADDSNPPSRVYFYGGRNNLPQYYRNERLCLPNRNKENSYLDFSAFQASLFPLGVSNSICEQICNIDDVYPASNPFVIKSNWSIAISSPSASEHYLQLTIPTSDFFDLSAVWKPRESAGGAADYAEWLILKQKTDTQDSRTSYETYYSGTTEEPKKVTKYMIGGDSPMFEFQGGDLGGYQLSMHSCVENNGNYLILLNVSKEENEDIDGYYVPNADVCCHVGDKFIISNINMPVAYTYYNGGDQYTQGVLTHHDYSAEYALWKAAIDYMNSFKDRIDYEISVGKGWVYSHHESFHCFDEVMFADIADESLGTIKRRVVSVERDLLDPLQYKLNLTNRGMIRPWKNLGKIVEQNKTER